MRKKILIFGHYGIPNWGDEAILAGILAQIDIQKFSITVVSDDKKFTKTHHGVKAIYPPAFGIRSFIRGGFFDFLKALNTADYVIIGGGGLFQDTPPKALKIWTYYLKFCLWKQKKIFVLGNSFEALSEKKKYDSLQKIFKKIFFFSVRDRVSAQILEQKIGVPTIKISSSSDAAYFLPSRPKRGRKKGILLAIRAGEIPLKREKKIIKILQEFFPKEFESNAVEILVMQEKNSGDSQFGKNHNLPLFFPESLDDLQEKIRSSRFVLTSRLHAGILANLSGTPFIALAPRKKISQFFGEKFSTPLSSIFTKKGEKKFRQQLKNFSLHKAAQKNFMLTEKKKLKNFFPEVLK